ncbi:hypothetical protein KHM83_11640 [Fusibacter paucivorans]|uniref:Uncharacterized protein n=1 Tax=Fusibacter paucivorans TaxID=76009 RepID=A0ABS5PQ87_9FIRM|nr:hypothetical protein [Fusibacter paucivorans]MBS7527334.1 hypothetical protein [Fusibacter paucivorans]
MRIDSSELYYAQQLANLYKSNSSTSSFSTDRLMSDATDSSSSLVDFLTSSEDDLKSLSSIQFEMMNSGFGQMQRFRNQGNEVMETFKENADAITEAATDLTSDDQLTLLSNLQASILEEVGGLTADTDLESLSEEEITALFNDVQSALETMKENGPPPMPPQFGAMMDAYGSNDDETVYSVETWLDKLQASLDDSDVYSASDLSAVLQGIVTDL